MKLFNHGKTANAGGAGPLGTAREKSRLGSKIKAGLRMGRETQLPEYITGNVSEELIRLEDLVKVYDTGALKVLGLKRINLTIHRGEFVAIMGQSGSGKSTLMNILGCLDRPSMGHYYLDGVDVAAMNPDELSLIRNRKIGFVFQSFNLISRTSALKNVELPMTYARKGRRFREQRAKVLLERVGLGKRAEHMPNELSGGQRQRVAIARALANEPPLLLADEPTGNLDTAASVEIMELFSRLHKEGTTVVVVTHEEEIAAFTERIIRFRDGEVVSDLPNVPREPGRQKVAGAGEPGQRETAGVGVAEHGEGAGMEVQKEHGESGAGISERKDESC